AMWLTRLGSTAARERVGRELGGAVAPEGLAARAHGALGIEIEARADSKALAIARCLAWIRAATAEVERAGAAAWLDDERRKIAVEISALERSMNDLPGGVREAATKLEAEVDAQRRRAFAELARRRPESVPNDLELVAAIARLLAAARGDLAET